MDLLIISDSGRFENMKNGLNDTGLYAVYMLFTVYISHTGVKIRWSSVLIRAIAVTLAIERGLYIIVATFKYI